MAGLTKNTPVPTEIKLHNKSRILDITFSDGKKFHYTCEFLRVYSPSAEVSGHGLGQEILQTGKKNVNILKIEPVGHYAIQLFFSDGHNTGLYSWDLLYKYGLNQDKMWQQYLQRLKDANATRESETGHSASHQACR
ncbi:MAG: DUF971 domain-containing protein [Burkholderiales bacterium]|nr:DUF971 domain-containing protein [Burkholderiales bacterium]